MDHTSFLNLGACQGMYRELEDGNRDKLTLIYGHIHVR